MKKHVYLAFILTVCLLLVACNETKPIYTTVEALTNDEAILSVTKDPYTMLSSMDLSILPEEFARIYRGILEETVTYQALYRVDDCTVCAYISLPKDYESSSKPVILYNRGGNGAFSALMAEEVANYSYFTGCIVIATNYREVPPGDGFDQFGGKDVKDVVFWMDKIPQLGFVDQDSVYMIGESRGGMQTCLALLHNGEQTIQAAACVSGIYDLANIYESRPDMQAMLRQRIGGSPKECPEEYTKRSAMFFVDKISTPLLVIHSTEDEQVPYEQAEAFAEALISNGKSAVFITRNDDCHGMASPDELIEILNQLKELSD